MTGTRAKILRQTSQHFVWLLCLGLVVLCGCASIEKGTYGVRNVNLEGVEQMGARSLANCLLTKERPDFGVTVGLSPAECGEPPFDGDAPRLSLWRWPWTDYQSFNPAVLELDTQRVLRWYRARGFYDAKVTEIRYNPPNVERSAGETAPGDCNPDKDECPVDITVTIEEGEPLIVRKTNLVGLGEEDREKLASVLDDLPKPGARFDEHDYDAGKQLLLAELREISYAAAKVSGEVEVDHEGKAVEIRYSVSTGPPYTFGKAIVAGSEGSSARRIIAAADVATGEPYEHSTLRVIQQDVYALGAFSAVEVQHVLAPGQRVDVRIRVSLLPKHAGRVGTGITSGALRRVPTGALESVPQWDVHVFGRYERRHIFGTLGKFQIEERPRLIFQEAFPGITPPRPGNIAKISVNQPGLVEKRTDLILTSQWDVGPEPYLGFTRHDIFVRLSGQRAFFRRHLYSTLSVQQDFYVVPSDQMTSDGSELPVGYGYSFLEEDLRLDFRDSSQLTTRGVYLGLTASQAPRWAGSAWTAFRLLPEARAYLPLPLHMVLAGRFAVGAIFITDANPVCDDTASVPGCLDETSRELGPTAYRLRGGGATSNRGFPAGRLGVGLVGGIRRWEASLELRIRLGESFGAVLFGDLGDVNDTEMFRFDQPNPSTGFGLRYLTPIGSFRFDAGFQLGPADPDDNLLPLLDTPGALHLTIGEAF